MEVENKVLEHDYELKEIKSILANVAKNQDTLFNDMRTIASSISKMDSIIERLGDFKAEIQEINARIKNYSLLEDKINRFDSNITWLWRTLLAGVISFLFIAFK